MPLAFVYTAWSCILGLKSSIAWPPSAVKDDSRFHSGTMYSWIVSNHPTLSTLNNVPVDISSFNYSTNLPENSLAVCNCVSNALRSIGLIAIYGADVTGGDVDPSSELVFFIGVERSICAKFADSVLLDEPMCPKSVTML